MIVVDWRERVLTVLMAAAAASCSSEPQEAVVPDGYDEMTNAAEQAAPTNQADSSVAFIAACLERHFPLAAQVPFERLPPEMRLYCAAPWDFAAFDSVVAALESGGVDLARLTVRNAPPERREALAATLPLALQQADQGPPGMGSLFRSFHSLPLLWAIEADLEAQVLSGMAEEDITPLRRAEQAIDWDRGVISAGSPIPEGQGLRADFKLRDMPELIQRIER